MTEPQKQQDLEIRLAAGLCTAVAAGCLPVLKWWAVGGWLRPVIAVIAVAATWLACSLYRFMVTGDLVRCLVFSAAGGFAGFIVWALFQLF